MQTITATRLYTPSFLQLCSSYALFAASFNMIIPELPAYLTQLGGEDYKGFIIALFTLTAGISRPFSGKLADTIGRKSVIYFGITVCVFCSLLYPLLTSVAGFLLLRLLHGFSTGFSPTATSAYVADIVPVHRRGEAMGILGISMNAGASIAPPIGSFLVNWQSLNAMFYASSAVAFVALLLLLPLKETLANQRRFHPSILRLKSNEILDKYAFLPALLCMATYFGYGVLLTIVPDQSVHLGMSNKGLFFTTFTAMSVFSRLVASRLSDIYGRVPVIRIAIVLLCIAYVLMGMSNSITWLLMASGAIGFATGIAGPAVFAWAIDRSVDSQRGKALATVYIGLEIAIGSGALLGAFIYNNNPLHFAATFYTVAVISAMGFFVLIGKEDGKLV
jgi:MFS family permease